MAEEQTQSTRFGLSSFVLKIIALLTMTADHIGYLLFPSETWLRIIGRLAFPIFAFVLAEGCRFTKRPLRRFLTIAVLGVICEIVYDIYSQSFYGNILLQLSFSVGLLMLLKESKKGFFGETPDYAKGWIFLFLFGVGIAGTAVFCHYLSLDYGFVGVLVPVIVGIVDFKGTRPPEFLSALDNFIVRLFLLAFALMLLCIQPTSASYQPWCFLALVPIVLYNGKAGKIKLKYFFYLYYPLHLLAIAGIAMLL